MKRLFIAEKPDMGRKIASFLPGGAQNKGGYMLANNGNDYVAWCIGHLLEQVTPEGYGEQYKRWNFDTLPILPGAWKMQITKDKTKQVATIKELLKEVDEIINAGDPGREGQLIVDEVLEFLKNKKPVKRILLNALDAKTVKAALANLEDNKKYFNLYMAGLGRQRADWLVGMNMTRAYTLIGQRKGNKGVLSVGRVQTPTLALVVKRDREIEGFVPQNYWIIKGHFDKDRKFIAKWQPTEAQLQAQAKDLEANKGPNKNVPWVEGERILDEKKAKAIVAKVTGKVGKVIEFIQERVQEPAPLPFDLSTLQIYANAKYGYSALETLDICQGLYEKGVLSYPRTDCQYLPENQFDDASTVLQSISNSMGSLSALVGKANPKFKSKVWNDKQLGEHHAIIPTSQSADWNGLSLQDKNIFEACVRRYLAQFFPLSEVDKTRLVIEVEHEHFVANGRIIFLEGWREVFEKGDEDLEHREDRGEDSKGKGKGKNGGAGEGENGENDEGDDSSAILPILKQGEQIVCNKAEAVAKQTKPPAYFTEGSLIKAMKYVHLFVSDPVMKQKLKSIEGIGRSATRANIIKTLIGRGLLVANKKKLNSSESARYLVDILPERLIDPGTTALWETALDGVAAGKINYDHFYSKQLDSMNALVAAARKDFDALPAPAGGGGGGKATGKACPKCQQGQLVERMARNGPNAGNKFLACTQYPACKYTENPK